MEEDTPKPSPNANRFVAFTWDELDTDRFKQIRHCGALLLVLRRYANWETGITTGAFSYFARAAGMHKGTAWRQIHRLRKIKLLEILQCRPGRRVNDPDWSKFQLFDCLGNPFTLRRRNFTVAQAQLNDCAGATNTSNKERTINNKGGDEERHVLSAAEKPGAVGGGARQPDADLPHNAEAWEIERDREKAVALLTSPCLGGARGFDERVARELSELNSFSACEAEVKSIKAQMQRRPKTVTNPYGLLRSNLGASARAKMGRGTNAKDQNRASPPKSDPSQDARGAVAAGRAGGSIDREAVRDPKRPANRPGGASDFVDPTQKREIDELQQILDSRRSTSPRRGSVAPIGKVFK